MSTPLRCFLVATAATLGLGLQRPGAVAPFATPPQDPAPVPAELTIPLMVELPTAWKVGDRVAVVLVKNRQKTDGHKVEAGHQSTTSATVEVLRADEAGWLFAWTWGETKLATDVPAEAAALAERLASLNAGMRLELEMDTFGSVIGLANVDEVLERFEKVYEALAESLTADGIDGADFTAIMASVKGMMNRDTLTQSAVRDPAQLFVMSGGSFPEGEVIETSEARPSLFGGPPIDVKSELALTQFDATANEATLHLHEVYDPRQSAISITAMMQQLAAEAGRPAPGDEEIPSVEITDEAEWVFDMKTGWPKSHYTERRSQVGTRGQIDRSEFTVTPLPPAESK